MIHVIAVITAKPGKREAILQVFRANVPAVRAEKGCMEYGAAVDAENALPVQTRWGPDTFLAMEKWDSVDALKAHAAAPHMAAYGARTKEMIASRVIHILAPTWKHPGVALPGPSEKEAENGKLLLVKSTTCIARHPLT